MQEDIYYLRQLQPAPSQRLFHVSRDANTELLGRCARHRFMETVIWTSMNLIVGGISNLIVSERALLFFHAHDISCLFRPTAHLATFADFRRRGRTCRVPHRRDSGRLHLIHSFETRTEWRVLIYKGGYFRGENKYAYDKQTHVRVSSYWFPWSDVVVSRTALILPTPSPTLRGTKTRSFPSVPPSSSHVRFCLFPLASLLIKPTLSGKIAPSKPSLISTQLSQQRNPRLVGSLLAIPLQSNISHSWTAKQPYLMAFRSRVMRTIAGLRLLLTRTGALLFVNDFVSHASISWSSRVLLCSDIHRS